MFREIVGRIVIEIEKKSSSYGERWEFLRCREKTTMAEVEIFEGNIYIFFRMGKTVNDFRLRGFMFGRREWEGFDLVFEGEVEDIMEVIFFELFFIRIFYVFVVVVFCERRFFYLLIYK